MVCIAGVLGNKQVALGPLAVEAGIFAFLLLVVTSSSVAELHGRPVANRLVLIGFVPLLTSLVLSLFVLALAALAADGPQRAFRFQHDDDGNAAHLAWRHLGLRRLDVPQRHDLQPVEGARRRRSSLAASGNRKRIEPDRRHADFHHRSPSMAYSRSASSCSARCLRKSFFRRSWCRPSSTPSSAWGVGWTR